MGATELGRVTLTRWRWRLRGASMWPTFAICVVADTLLLHVLPISGAAMSLSDAFIIAGFLNLVAVAVLAPLLGLLLRRVRPDLPRVVAADDAGAAALLAIALLVLAAGLVHRPTVVAAQRSFQAQGLALRRYVLERAPADAGNLDRANTVELYTGFYRTCVPTNEPSKALCLFVDTSRSPPAVRLDSDSDPNWRYFLERPGDYSVQPAP